MFRKTLSARDVRNARVQAFRQRQIDAIRDRDATAREWQGTARPRATAPAHDDARTSARLINFALVTIGAAVMAGTVAGLAYSAIVETFARVAAAL